MILPSIVEDMGCHHQIFEHRDDTKIRDCHQPLFVVVVVVECHQSDKG